MTNQSFSLDVYERVAFLQGKLSDDDIKKVVDVIFWAIEAANVESGNIYPSNNNKNKIGFINRILSYLDRNRNNDKSKNRF